MFQVNIASLSQVNVMIAQGVNLLPRLRHRLIASSSSGFKYKLFILISEGINMPEIRLESGAVFLCFVICRWEFFQHTYILKLGRFMRTLKIKTIAFIGIQ